MRILVLSEPFGLGHTMVATAIKESLRMDQLDWQVDVSELSIELQPIFSRVAASLYIKSLKYSPRLWGAVYRKSQHSSINHQFQFLLQHVLYVRVNTYINDYKPDVIICTHPFPSAVIARLKKNGLQVKLCTVITDFCLHKAWLSEYVDHYFLPSESVNQELILAGVPKNRLHVTGIPTHPKFSINRNKLWQRSKLGVKNMPTILCMGGGLGIGLPEKILDTLSKRINMIQVILIAGKNTSMFEAIKKTSLYSHPNFHLHSFVENIHELMTISDVIITKPGGVTCAEAMDIGIPMLLTDPLPGQEEGNLRYILEQKYGIYIANETILDSCLQQLAENPILFLKQFSSPLLRNSDKVRIGQLIEKIS